MRLNIIIDFIRRERLYAFLLAFVIFSNFSLSSMGNVFKESGLSKTFEKQASSGESGVFERKAAESISVNPAAYNVFFLLLLTVLFFAAAGTVIDGIFFYKKISAGDPIIMTRHVNAVSWGFWDICKVIIIFFFAKAVVSFAAIYVSFTLPDIHIGRNLQMMIFAAALDIVVAAALFYFVSGRGRQNIALLGLTAENMFRNIKYGITAYIGLIPVFLTVTLLMSFVFKALRIPIEPQEIVEMLKDEKGIPSLLSMCFFVSLVGPFVEEVFFRGFVYGVFRKKIGIFGGILASALFFACVHANMASFAPILCLGILLAYIYEKTGSLISSITVHVIHNSLMLAFLLFLKSAAG